jgi:hypothetical protein
MKVHELRNAHYKLTELKGSAMLKKLSQKDQETIFNHILPARVELGNFLSLVEEIDLTRLIRSLMKK